MIAGCGNKSFTTGYFDTGKYMHAEYQRLGAIPHLKINKGLYLNGAWEYQEIEPADTTAWNTELEIFLESNINKTAFNDLYKTDTLFVDTESNIKVSYTAKEADLRVRWMHVYYAPNNPKPVLYEARMERSNALYSSSQELIYDPNVGYAITGQQDVLFLGKDSFIIQGNFIMP